MTPRQVMAGRARLDADPTPKLDALGLVECASCGALLPEADVMGDGETDRAYCNETCLVDYGIYQRDKAEGMKEDAALARWEARQEAHREGRGHA